MGQDRLTDRGEGDGNDGNGWLTLAAQLTGQLAVHFLQRGWICAARAVNRLRYSLGFGRSPQQCLARYSAAIKSSKVCSAPRSSG